MWRNNSKQAERLPHRTEAGCVPAKRLAQVTPEGEDGGWVLNKSEGGNIMKNLVAILLLLLVALLYSIFTSPILADEPKQGDAGL